MNAYVSNVKKFGAKGDGVTDDTVAILTAIKHAEEETGEVFFPVGVYMMHPITLPSHITLRGNSSWSYLGSRCDKEGNSLDPGYQGRVILRALSGNARAFLDLDGKNGTRILGLTLDGANQGEGMHGIYTHNIGIEQHICIEDCRIENFTGSGVRLDKVWVFSIRRNLIMNNHQHGVDCSRGYDGWIIDNQLTGNKGAGLYAGGIADVWTGMATVMVTANRIEWNREAGIKLFEANTMQFTGNSIDHNFGPGIFLKGCKSGTICGNVIRSSAVEREDDESCHLYLEDCLGVAVTGNSLWGWFDRKEFELVKAAPYYNFVLKNNKDCVVATNAIFEGSGRENVRDLGGNENTTIAENRASFPDAKAYGLRP